MQSWSSVPVPDLPGIGPDLRLFDTASGELRTLEPGPTARMYACGITPYDATHLGHAATYLAWDLIGRMWRDADRDVQYTQNVTDVDEPLLERAERDGEDWRDLAAREIALFRADMAALRILPPTHFVGAVESMELIAALVSRLRDAGATYLVEDDLYFSVAADPGFGSLSHAARSTMAALSAERGGDPDRPGKKDPLDPLLWRAARPGEPSWDSALGSGRPGWHVECAAIALDRLGPDFDLAAGGNDLIFPHHEMSAAHGRVATGGSYARAHVHAGMIALDGEKMSKSLGNLVFVSRLRSDGVDLMQIRLALLAGHYRVDRPWTSDLLDAASHRQAHWRHALAGPGGPDGAAVLAQVRERLADDLDSAGALAAVDRWADAALTGERPDTHAPATVRDTVDSLLGIVT